MRSNSNAASTMSDTISPQDLLVPNQAERQQLFYLLRKISSITAWRRAHAYYKAWVDVTKRSLQEATKQGWALTTSLPASELQYISGGLAEFDKALAIMEKDNFKQFDTPPFLELSEARRRLGIQLSVLGRIDDGENGVNEAHTPLWQEYCEAMSDAYDVWQECSIHLAQRGYFPGGLWYYNLALRRDLPVSPAPLILPAVPDPQVNRFARPDRIVPCAGIWEPVAAPASSLIGCFTGAWKPAAPFVVVGPMCYFNNRSFAPAISLERDSDSAHPAEKLHMAWRLLWQEDRYRDGLVTEEEAHYEFIDPRHSHPESSATVGDGGPAWAWSGAAAPVSGRWLLESEGSYTKIRKKGQRMPFALGGLSVRWVLMRQDD